MQPGISPWEFQESLIRALFVFCVLIPFLLIKIDETNLLQEVHWFYSHLTFFREGGKGEKFVFFVLG